ncbi:MAG: DUF1824 family protein [Geitlerinemataceae cyanobacterium]
MNSDLPKLNIAEAKTLLKQYSLAGYSPANKGVDTPTEMGVDDESLYSFHRLRQALELVARNSEYQIFGVCAQSAEEGLQALTEYLQALGYQPPEDIESIEGPVYMKFNPNIGLHYMSPYEGQDRGVLVSCQSPNSDGINEIYGHLPLDLFVPKVRNKI